MTVSQQAAQAITTEEFLEKVLPQSGIYMLFLTKEKKNFHRSYTNIDTMASAVDWFDNSGYSVYHACSSFHTEESRKADNTAHFRSFFLDLDCGLKKANEGKGFIDKAAACNALKDFCKKLGLPKPTIIDSGGGFHVYWTLQDDIEADEWLSLATKLKQLTKFHKFAADHSRTSDRASLLRPVKATNHKYSPARQVKALYVADDASFNDIKVKIEAAEASSDSFGATPKIPTLTQLDQNLLGMAPQLETPKNIQRVLDALGYVNADCSYEIWRDCVWALLSSGWNCAAELATNWSRQSAQHWKYGDGEKALQNLLAGFDPEKTVTLGTLFHHAFENGYTKGPNDQVDMSPVSYNKEIEKPQSSTVIKLYSRSELAARPDPKWVVRNILPETGIAAIYGAPSSGKTFVALDLANHISLGKSAWFGHKVKTSPVVYVALEGGGCIKHRLEAWEAENSDVSNVLTVLDHVTLNNLDHAAALAHAVSSQCEQGAVVFIDTLAQAIPGADENSGKDMGLALEAAKHIAASVGGLVVLVHHTGKDKSKGLRGHSSVHAALDAAIVVERNAMTDHRSWKVSKMKDGEDGHAGSFELIIHQLRNDQYGAAITSCAVREQTYFPTSTGTKMPTGKHQITVLEALQSIEGEAEWSNVEILKMAKTALGDVASKHRAARAKDAISSLVDGGYLQLNDEVYSLKIAPDHRPSAPLEGSGAGRV
ncbi:AAA family ATPase [Amylibacter sp.]|nr:AAA family ATPase [Amylibacter sp.]